MKITSTIVGGDMTISGNMTETTLYQPTGPQYKCNKNWYYLGEHDTVVVDFIFMDQFRVV